MRFYIAAATRPQNWRRRVQAVSEPTLAGCVGPGASEASRQLSAVLSETGVPNRWLSLRRRPTLLQETLQNPDWENSALHQLMRDVPLLILDAEENQLHRLWRYLYSAGLVDNILFFPGHPIPEPLHAREPEDLQTWAEASEALRSDMELAGGWLPCTFTPILS